MGVQFYRHVHPSRVSRHDGSRSILRPAECANSDGEKPGVAGLMVVHHVRLDPDCGTVDGTVYSNGEVVPGRQDHGVGHCSTAY